MSDKSDFDMILEFAEKMKKEGKEKAIKDKWENTKKQINKLKIGLFFAIISPFVGIPLGVFLLNMMHNLMESINQFR